MRAYLPIRPAELVPPPPLKRPQLGYSAAEKLISPQRFAGLARARDLDIICASNQQPPILRLVPGRPCVMVETNLGETGRFSGALGERSYLIFQFRQAHCCWLQFARAAEAGRARAVKSI